MSKSGGPSSPSFVIRHSTFVNLRFAWATLDILTTYSGAVDLWKKGLEAMTKDGGGVAKGQQMLKQGDSQRARAIADFDSAYASPKKPL